ncbi:formate C-acetyltransferase [Thermosyntropha lipolytica DSM 11003]|uniref:Formate acetyltransferase n=1 Tax=Thermosyntropha lipolytica DSM 11003 TaxID=1123382 RepID=A0A1M5PVA2_9FIRM|nr:formate C-acetyltransferase [Thermosyntropha lipolytica]SHH05213.1 formate C-acetyltransferase [Thermosyntropha lipolytica DSM 11003]
MQEWRSFRPGKWMEEIDVRDFIQKNYTPYDGDSSFLQGKTERTARLWNKCQELLKAEFKKGGVLKVDPETPITITSHAPGYIDKDLEIIVGLQTDEPLKRAMNLYGGLRMAVKACRAYGYEPAPDIIDFFAQHRTTHNDGVFSVYTPAMRLARRVGIITGLPDSYGRGRIIGDYRRVPLYGVDWLIEHKKKDLTSLNPLMSPEMIQLREEIARQIKALEDLKKMALSYGFDIGKPAANAREAVQWLYFAYLAAIKEQNGAAMSLGRNTTFLDIYIERDLKEGTLSEEEAQELIDQFVIKLRLVRHLRTPEYNELFAGDPNWVTEAIGGAGIDGRHMVTKTSYRFLQTLRNLGPAPEPNMTILWSQNLPVNFIRFCCELSILTSALQYENDDVMREFYGDDYAIACCVSGMRIGKEMQFFGARCNLAKLLLYAINGGRDEITGEQVGPPLPPCTGEYLDYEDIMERLSRQMDWLAELYVNTMNVIHYMHDKYAYESLQMALHDSSVHRYMAFGIAGLSVAADSLSAIKYARVKPVYDERKIAIDFITEGDFPKYGNDDDKVDKIAVELVKMFISKLKKHQTYRQSEPTLSILTITSNVMYGKHTGTTPDGRKKGEPLAPGANPLHGREEKGALAALNSVAKIPYKYAKDGISFTFSVVPSALGKNSEERINNLKALLHGYFIQEAHHINVNVLSIETLKEAMEHPEKYPYLTIRVSGYAVHFVKLSREQQEEIIMRTFYKTM